MVTVILGLAINECSEVSPWCARKLVRWSAHCRYADPARADVRAEELSALIDDRPGKLFKLITALGLAVAAVTVSARRAVTRRSAERREGQAELPAYSGPDSMVRLLYDLVSDGARTRRFLILMTISVACFGLLSAGADLLFVYLVRGLGKLEVVPSAGLVILGLLTVLWWVRRARRTPGAWFGVLWGVIEDEGRAMRPVVLVAVSSGVIALLFAGVLLSLRNFGVLSAVPATGGIAFVVPSVRSTVARIAAKRARRRMRRLG